MTKITQNHKWTAQHYAHQRGADWIRNLAEMHERQAREMRAYLKRFEEAAQVERGVAEADPHLKVTTFDVLGWVALQLNYVPNNARVDMLPRITADIVVANNS